jgi:hypothetical protein
LDCTHIFTGVFGGCFPHISHYVATQTVKSLDIKNLTDTLGFDSFCDFCHNPIFDHFILIIIIILFTEKDKKNDDDDKKK